MIKWNPFLGDRTTGRLACLGFGLLALSCSSRNKVETPVKAESFSEVVRRSLAASSGYYDFKKKGPFSVTSKVDIGISLEAQQKVLADLYLSEHDSSAPLLIFVHGNESYKEAHQGQAALAASWGFHSLVLQMPEESKWIANGHLLADVVRFLYAWPNFLGKPFDINKMILVGHSFGGSAVALALAQKIPVMGAVLLDPALFHSRLRKSLKAITVPVMLLGADEEVFKSKKRSWFRKNIRSEFTEISITGATHYDAQSPSQIALNYWGLDLTTTDELQENFKAALVSSALSLSVRGDFSFAVASFAASVAKGDIKMRANRISSHRKG